ncbi:MAG: ArnT family glycosyltransferase, partial [Ktedonobacteraceae bacterium]
MPWFWSRIRLGTLLLCLLVLALLVVDRICYAVTLPVKIAIQNGIGILQVGSQTVQLGAIGTPAQLQFVAHDPVVHEFQLDGTDSTNNFTLDTTYLHSISSSAYYRFQAWMRDLDGTSRWRYLQVQADHHLLTQIDWVPDSLAVPLPSHGALNINLQLQRPETPMTLMLNGTDGTAVSILFDRNDRQITVTHLGPNVTTPAPATKTFFPLDPLPFAAMVLDFLVRTLLWTLLVFVVVLVGEMGVTLIRWCFTRLRAQVAQRSIWVKMNKIDDNLSQRYFLTQALHPLALGALGASLCFVSWIALVQYQAEPHIYDASAYLFAAKMYALGHLSVPIPPAVDRFPGPFMVLFNGQWFGQYAPGTSLTLVPGIWLGVPWLVEPILGTFALLGIGLIAARLYDRRVATLAVILGTLSPFYSYLAASYLSHAIALFYLVWGLWALIRFAQGEAAWNLLLAAALFGMAGLTRDLVAVLFVAIVLPGVLILSWRRLRLDWRRWIIPGVAFLAIACIFLVITLGFNRTLTGSPWTSPRSLFFPGDHWGFGANVGFYGEHTLAAGFVNLDE